MRFRVCTVLTAVRLNRDLLKTIYLEISVVIGFVMKFSFSREIKLKFKTKSFRVLIFFLFVNFYKYYLLILKEYKSEKFES